MSKVEIMSSAAIAAKRLALQAELSNLTAVEDAAKQKEASDVTAVIKTFPALLKKVLKREVSEADMLNMIRHVGKHGSLSVTVSTGTVDRTRLTDAERDAVRADMLARAAALKAGTHAEPVSVLAAKHGITVATIANYKPTAEQVAALPGTVEVPASAIAAA